MRQRRQKRREKWDRTEWRQKTTGMKPESKLWIKKKQNIQSRRSTSQVFLISFCSFIEDFSFKKFLCDLAFFSFYPFLFSWIPSLHEEVLQQAGDEDGEACKRAHNQCREALVAGDQARPFATVHGAQIARGSRLLPTQREQRRGAERSAEFLACVLAAAAGTHAEPIVCVALEAGDLESTILSLKNLWRKKWIQIIYKCNSDEHKPTDVALCLKPYFDIFLLCRFVLSLNVCTNIKDIFIFITQHSVCRVQQ